MTGSARLRFVPLLCPDCGDDLCGRAEDLLAFCAACGTAWRCDGDALERWPAGRITQPPEGRGRWIALPVWVHGGLVVPAFLGPRPLSVARVLAREIVDLPAERGVDPPLPLGARVPPEAIGPAAPLLGEAPPAGGRRPFLLSLPVRVTDRHLLLPGTRQVLFPEDVLELTGLLAHAPSSAPSPAEGSPSSPG